MTEAISGLLMGALFALPFLAVFWVVLAIVRKLRQ